jgi:hypothetical protein
MRMHFPGEKGVCRLAFRPAARRRALCLLLALTAGGVAGCESAGFNDVPAANVAPDQYQGLTCDRMRAEALKLNTKKSDLAPALFPSISEGEREHQLAEVNGELNALAKASANCSK